MQVLVRQIWSVDFSERQIKLFLVLFQSKDQPRLVFEHENTSLIKHLHSLFA